MITYQSWKMERMNRLELTISLNRFVPKSYFMKKLGLTMVNYSHWKNRNKRFKEVYFPAMDCTLIDMDTLKLSITLHDRYDNVLDYRFKKYRFRDRLIDIEEMTKST